VAISIASVVAHAVRVALAGGAMLLIGALASVVMGWVTSMAGIGSFTSIVVAFLLVAIIGIAGGTYVSIRHIALNSVLHPVAAGVLLGLFPVGVTFQGDAGLMRVAIVLIAAAIAAIAALIIRYRTTSPKISQQRTRGG
jgi:hypothetical protein